jgi:two-component system sensor histidine kinase KdpD
MAERLKPPKARLLVCVGPNPGCADLIRAAKNLAGALQAEWFAVYVENPRILRLPEVERNRAVYNLRLAEQLGVGYRMGYKE